MLFQQLKWVRENRFKMCNNLKSRVIADYKPVKYVPCFLQKLVCKLKESGINIGLLFNLIRCTEVLLNCEHLPIRLVSK